MQYFLFSIDDKEKNIMYELKNWREYFVKHIGSKNSCLLSERSRGLYDYLHQDHIEHFNTFSVSVNFYVFFVVVYFYLFSHLSTRHLLYSLNNTAFNLSCLLTISLQSAYYGF